MNIYVGDYGYLGADIIIAKTRNQAFEYLLKDNDNSETATKYLNENKDRIIEAFEEYEIKEGLVFGTRGE